eukprot:TRINITY_DN13335_c0_g1_i1.p1 TRINITY_DN13335_c0_g1~~TRINITY_DN13335_c0_g1_i1.p1  ORF type:complete len:158 (+),score=39.08 TRINITY_DN13335_c0_g1_i1:26-475(+)
MERLTRSTQEEFYNNSVELLNNPMLFSTYTPQDTDYSVVFKDEYVEEAKANCARVFENLTPENIKLALQGFEKAEVHVLTESAESIGASNIWDEYDIPEEYHEISKCVRAGVRMVFVQYCKPGESRGFDIFVKMGDRWSWFPKVYALVD